MYDAWLIRISIGDHRGWTIWFQDGDSDTVLVDDGLIPLWDTRARLVNALKDGPYELHFPGEGDYRWRFDIQGLVSRLDSVRWAWAPSVRARVLDTINLLLDARRAVDRNAALTPDLSSLLDILTFAYGPASRELESVDKPAVRKAVQELVALVDSRITRVN